jgi:hypothetical protein
MKESPHSPGDRVPEEGEVIHIGDYVDHKLVARCGDKDAHTFTHGEDTKLNECQDCESFNCSWCDGSGRISDGYETYKCNHCDIDRRV